MVIALCKQFHYTEVIQSDKEILSQCQRFWCRFQVCNGSTDRAAYRFHSYFVTLLFGYLKKTWVMLIVNTKHHYSVHGSYVFVEFFTFCHFVIFSLINFAFHLRFRIELWLFKGGWGDYKVRIGYCKKCFLHFCEKMKFNTLE